MRLYLASTSPARLQTLRAAGIEPIAIAPGVDEEAAVAAAEAASGPLEAPDMVPDDRAYLADAAAMLQWSEDPWHALTAALKASTGRKGKALFLPLRLALTGRDHGPDMAALLPLIGESQARERLLAAAQA